MGTFQGVIGSSDHKKKDEVDLKVLIQGMPKEESLMDDSISQYAQHIQETHRNW